MVGINVTLDSAISRDAVLTEIDVLIIGIFCYDQKQKQETKFCNGDIFCSLRHDVRTFIGPLLQCSSHQWMVDTMQSHCRFQRQVWLKTK